MTRERQPIKPWQKATAAAAVLLAGLDATVAIQKITSHHSEIAGISHVPPFANYPVLDSEVAFIKKDYGKFLATWTNIYPQMKDVSLDLTLSGETSCKAGFFSKTTVNSNNMNGLEFCFPENKVIMTRAGINLMNEYSVPYANTWRTANDTPADYRPAVEHELLDLTLAHELGHAVQHATVGDVSESSSVELQADCYAGEAFRDNALPITRKEVKTLYELIAPPYMPDPTHGTTAQRIASFENGLSGEICTLQQ